jgi:hypothetical protein
MDRDRNMDTYGQGHRQTGRGHRRTGTQTDRDRNTDGKNRDTYRQGHRWTGAGTGEGTQRDTDRNNNEQLTKIRALKALNFKEFYKIKF